MLISNHASMENVENQIALPAWTPPIVRPAAEYSSFIRALAFVEYRIVKFALNKVAVNVMRAFLPAQISWPAIGCASAIAKNVQI